MTDNTQNDSWDDSLPVVDCPGPYYDHNRARDFIMGRGTPWTLIVRHPRFISVVRNNFHRFRTLRQLDLSMCELEAIPEHAFLNCIDLQQVKLPASLRRIGRGAFENAALTGLDLSKCTTLTSISNGAFCVCKSLERVALPPSLETIGEKAFWGCEKLKRVDFPESLTTIEERAFEHSGIQSVYIPNSVEFIGDESFHGCKKLKVLDLSATNENLSIESSAFADCEALTQVEYPNKLVASQVLWPTLLSGRWFSSHPLRADDNESQSNQSEKASVIFNFLRTNSVLLGASSTMTKQGA